MNFLLVFFVGWMVSFLGQLPLNAMSITTTQIAVEENYTEAWKFAAGLAIVEMIYLRILLSGVDWIMAHELFFKILGWLTVLLFFVLGVASFMAAKKQNKEKKALLLDNKINRFWLGFSMSAINPLQIPFWFIWSSYFMNNNVLHADFNEFNFFTLGSGLGTLSGLAVYMYGGNWLINKLKTSNKTLNKLMAVVFVIAAFIQLYRMIYEPLIQK
ncbi:MAG: LysE family transporter [Chitinophagaceae bacterium]